MSEVKKIYPTLSDEGNDDVAVTVSHDGSDYMPFKLSVTGWKDGEKTRALHFDSDHAIKVADAIYEQAGRSKPEAENLTYNEAALRLAVAHDLKAKFSYIKENGEERVVRLWPEVIEDGLVAGFDYDRDDIRQFRLDRIQGNVVIG